MKIIQISSYYPPRLGGMQNVVRELSERLANKGHDVTVFTSKIGTKHGRIYSSKNLDIRYLRAFEFAHTAILPGLFFSLLRVPRDSIIHIHTRPFVAEVAAMAAKIRKIPYIFEVHSDIYPLGFFKFLIPLYKRTGWRWVMQHADIVIFLSQDQERNLKDEYSLKRTIVIPNGVDKKFYVRRKTISKQRPAHILSVGRLSKEKNLNLLIEAFSQIKQSATLDIIGEGPDRARLQKLIKYKHLESSVNLYGKLVGDSLIEKYRNADIYVMTSFSEGLSLSMLEAMAASLPVVAFDAPGVTEHIGRIGVVINSHEPGALSLALDKLLSDKQGLSVLSEKSSTYAASFSWPSVINRLDRLYEKVYKRQL